MLVLDEASQLSTADLAMIGEAARQAGARIIATGDTAQLGAVEAGGMFRLLAQEVPAAQLHEVRRFDAQWEREASVRLRDGDLAAAAAYDRHGRIRGADEEAAYDRAASMWLADHLRGKNVLLLAGSNAEAAELSRRVQARLIQLGTVGPPQAALSDGNHAGTGDLVRARLNAEIDAGGRKLTNRDTLKITGWRGPDAEVRRQRLDGTWTEPFRVPRSYLARNAELALRRQRPRRPGPHRRHRAPPGHRHLVPAGPVRRHDPRPPSPTPRTWSPARPPRPGMSRTSRPPRNPCWQMSCSATGTTSRPPSRSGTLRNGPGEPVTCSTCGPRPPGKPCTRDIDQQIKARLTESEAWRYQREHSRQVLQHSCEMLS